LTREGIVAAALAVLRSEGLERVTMRRLAQELDTGPASLYVYVRNTADLRAYMLDELLMGLDVTDTTPERDWRAQLVVLLTSYVRALAEHPGLALSALVTRPSGPGYLNLVERVLALLSQGVDARRAAWGVDLLLHHATSTAAEQGTWAHSPEADADEDRVLAALRAVTPETYPHIAALGMDLMSGEGLDRVVWAFHVLLNGIAGTERTDDPAAD
jgi:AcrR family transcriptional regulator